MFTIEYRLSSYLSRQGACTVLALYAFCWISLLAQAVLGQDTTPPTLSVVFVQPFIFHLLVNVQLNEDGKVYCGALLSSNSWTPSAYELKNNQNLRGHGTATVTGGVHTNVIVSGLLPGTIYDVFCYAEDTMLNGMSVADVAATQRFAVATASGGDYVAPTFSYVSPFQTMESQAMIIYVQLSEDGTVWCVARKDSGSGTSVPSSAEIQQNLNVDAWGTTPITAANLYQGAIRLFGLSEDTIYDVYCFAKDMSNNGIDGTPAFPADSTKIAATKRAGLRTLAIYNPSRLSVFFSSGTQYYTVEPATWNLHLPTCHRAWQGNEKQKRCGRDLESWKNPLELKSARLVSQASHPSSGCAGQLPAAPMGGGPFVLLLRRGKCSFSQKAVNAHRSGYSGILVIDHQLVLYQGVLPDMTAGGDDASVSTPAWIIGKSDGEVLASAAAAMQGGWISLDLIDQYRKPRLGDLQSDRYGLRVYARN
eukprot:TRINITY_DN95224_c0_g1_i1.p1 TRINITY_DN95224_c0_g1~~TRINITY_DN95224_c0_g1_i1.p1  ORF type:complete len:478 (+),score=73.42 TRINITY_DN95224_c0_g1_i1:108-1541(+)